MSDKQDFEMRGVMSFGPLRPGLSTSCEGPWRVAIQKRDKGPYCALIRGRSGRPGYASFTLGYVDERTRDICLLAINQEHHKVLGTPLEGRAMELAERDPTLLGKFLLTGDESVFGEQAKDYGGMTLKTYFDQVWWPVRSGAKPDRNHPAVALKTQANEQGFWKQINGALGHLVMRELTALDFDGYLGAMEQSGATKRLHRNAYKQQLEYARRKAHIDHVHKFFRIAGATKRAWKQEEPLTVDEVGALLRVSDAKHRCMWGIGIGQGLRPGELANLRWEDFHPELMTMFVRGTKTEASRASIPMTPFTKAELERYRATFSEPPIGGWMFLNQQSTGPLKSFKNSLKSASRRAGIDKNVHPNLLRHSFATLAWAFEIPIEVAQAIMRHTSREMLIRVYQRPRPQDMAARLKGFEIKVD
jgi:integrase